MKSQIILPLALAASLSLLAACQKPAATTDSTTAAATTTPDATAPTTVNPAPEATASSGGAVSPPAANGAVNTDGNTTSANVASASNSFTEGQAKSHIEKAGYANVTALAKTPDGMWTAQATKGGAPVTVVVDFKGAVTTQ